MNNFQFIRYIGHGATSYVFEGIWGYRRVALKWVQNKSGTHEVNNLKMLMEWNCSNVVLPIYYEKNNWTLSQFVGKEPIELRKVYDTIERDPPFLSKIKSDYHLRGNLNSWIIIFPLMKGDLNNIENINYQHLYHDIKEALECINSHGYCHNDLAKRNILYNDNKYYLSDFGDLTPCGDDEVEDLVHIINKFK